MKTLITKPQAGLSGNEKKSSVNTAQAVLRQNLPQNKTTKTKTNKSLFTLLLQLLIINCALLIATADATIRYVSPHGSNEPPYTSWATSAHSIQSCIDISSSGDTIYVGNGVYKEQVIMIPGLTLIGAGADSCIINTIGFNPIVPTTVTVKDSCVFQGFKVIPYHNSEGGAGIAGIGNAYLIVNNKVENGLRGIYAGSVAGMVIYNTCSGNRIGIDVFNSNSTVSNNIIQHNNQLGSGIMIGAFNNNYTPVVDSNLIILDRTGGARGIYKSFGARPYITNNTIVLIQSYLGIFLGTADSGKVYNNLVIAAPGSQGIDNHSVQFIKIYNNYLTGTFTNSSGALVVGPDNSVKNNVISGAKHGVRAWGNQNLVYKYNNVWNNESNYSGFTPDTTNLTVNPMIMNDDTTKGELDFRLQMYSPLIDAGDPDILDVDGSRSDIGLYGGPYGMSYQYIDLPPRPPQNVIAVLDSMDVTIKWNPNTESDFNHYKLFRDTTANFIADSTTFVMSLTDTFYNHIIPPGINNYYYKLTAVDNQRNESLPSEEIAVNISSMTMNDYPMTINDYILYQNYPNPFNPSTKIAYRLKEGGYVKLYVYDIKGELVDILVNQHQEGGYYEVEFNASAGSHQSSVINPIASGIYLYQLMVRNDNSIPVFTDTKKMLHLK